MGKGNEERKAQTIIDFRIDNHNDFAALVAKYTNNPGINTPQKRRKNTVRERLIKQQDEIKQSFIDGKTACEVAFDFNVGREYILTFTREVFGKEFYYEHVFYGGRVK